MQKLEHKLKARHLRMLALGAMIGTGLFFGSAKTIHATGPAVFLAYIICGMVIYIISRSLGEMVVDRPVSGAFSEYANLYIGRFAGFITGWSAWFEYVVVSMAELTAITVFLDYFVPGIPHWMVCMVILLLFTGINLFGVRVFGELEFWFAGIKILAIILALLFSVYLVCFNVVDISHIFYYNKLSTFFAGGINGFLMSLVVVAFSFGGIESIGVAAGESENPQQNVPKAINGIIFRIVVFYVFTTAMVIVLYPYNKLSTHVSPFVDVFAKIGFINAAIMINIVAICAALSAFNSCLYTASRILYSLAANHHAPYILSHISNNSRSIPVRSILATSAIVCIAVIVNYLYPEKALMYLMFVTTAALLIVWFMILVTQFYFRSYKRLHSEPILYKSLWFPYSNIAAIIFLCIVLGVMTQMENMRTVVYITPLWILILSIAYVIRKRYYK